MLKLVRIEKISTGYSQHFICENFNIRFSKGVLIINFYNVLKPDVSHFGINDYIFQKSSGFLSYDSIVLPHFCDISVDTFDDVSDVARKLYEEAKKYREEF